MAIRVGLVGFLEERHRIFFFLVCLILLLLEFVFVNDLARQEKLSTVIHYRSDESIDVTSGRNPVRLCEGPCLLLRGLAADDEGCCWKD